MCCRRKTLQHILFLVYAIFDAPILMGSIDVTVIVSRKVPDLLHGGGEEKVIAVLAFDIVQAKVCAVGEVPKTVDTFGYLHENALTDGDIRCNAGMLVFHLQRGEFFLDLACDGENFLFGIAFIDDHELVTAVAPYVDALVLFQFLQHAGNGNETFIACLMTVIIVIFLARKLKDRRSLGLWKK